MLDRDESALHAVELSIYGQGLLDSDRTVLVDIRDSAALHKVVEQCRPDVIFHAAALKHLPLLERFPTEALKSNVYGTLNVLDAAAAVGVSHFVNISTDKAANPASALGHSKRLAELLTSWYSREHSDARYLSVRFGNVLGSRGSVLHAFAAQIDAGGPVTVTDPEVTRYFMTIPEACQLVIQAGAIGRPGEALVLDMGAPVKILDVAKRMIAMSGQVVEVVITGLREGEKLHEDLFDTGETDTRPVHELISHVTVPPLDPSVIEDELWPRLVRREAADDELTRGSSWTR
jgi:FlaA1/EpsC-like NDP-sugar epimerase